jgi:hypothetical protein
VENEQPESLHDILVESGKLLDYFPKKENTLPQFSTLAL